MDREILFRGKRVRNGEWVYGYYANCRPPRGRIYETRHYIIEYPGTYHEIYTSTLGQFTGLADKHGKKIFEGDIVRFCDILCEITWKGAGFETAHIEGQAWTFPYLPSNAVRMEVIGNIHDNPELIGGN